MNQRSDVTDLIPKGLGVYWILFLGGVLGVAALEFAYFKMPGWAERVSLPVIPALDVASNGSVLTWFVSTLFLLAAGVALLNSRLGLKHADPAKGDVWFWASFALVLLSLDTHVLFRETLRDLLVYASGTRLHQNGDVWWLTIYSFVFGLIGIRLLLDMLAYRPACFLFFVALVGIVAAQLVRIEVIRIQATPTEIIMIRTALEAVGVLTLFLSFLLFGRRQVLRDPEVALQWFAKVWNQSPMTKNIPMPTSVPAPSAPVAESSPQPSKPASPPAQQPAPQAAKPQRATDSAVLRPVLQKSEQTTVPFRNTDPNDDDFSLLNVS